MPFLALLPKNGLVRFVRASFLFYNPYCIAPLKRNLVTVTLVVSVVMTVVINYYGHCKRDLLSRRYVYQILPIEVYLIELLL